MCQSQITSACKAVALDPQHGGTMTSVHKVYSWGTEGRGYCNKWVCSPTFETPTQIFTFAERLNIRLKLTRMEIALLSAVVLFAAGKSDY